MNPEELMRVYIVESRYEGDLETGINVVDVPAVPFLNCSNPLYIGVRQGQVKRMRNNINHEKLGGTSVGFWELNPSYITKKGKINWDEFKKHDVIFLASPDRIHDNARPAYSQLIKEVTSALC